MPALPDRSGYDVARELRQDPALAAVRIIAITGYGQEQDRRQAMAAIAPVAFGRWGSARLSGAGPDGGTPGRGGAAESLPGAAADAGQLTVRFVSSPGR